MSKNHDGVIKPDFGIEVTNQKFKNVFLLRSLRGRRTEGFNEL